MRVVIVGGGFAGLNAAKGLGSRPGVEVVVLDRRNHHLFQPLLYQVAMAGLSPADIAAPIRALLSRHRNITVIQSEVSGVDLESRVVEASHGEVTYDYLVLATGARHAYFGHPEWEENAPGLKTLAQATEIRRRVLQAFERAEATLDDDERRALLTFVVVGAGPTGVELAGAIGEMSRSTLARDFRSIDPRSARVLLIEAGARILPSFSTKSATRAALDLASLGVEVITGSAVTRVDSTGVGLGEQVVAARTVLWAAGVEASAIGRRLGVATDRQGRVKPGPDLSLPGHPEVFLAGDLARVENEHGDPLPGTAPVALQQGRHIARVVRAKMEGRPRPRFEFRDKGQMATIGRSRAVVEVGGVHLAGFAAWMVWLTIHIYYLSGFRNRLLVVVQWAWSYATFGRGARLIVDREWRFGRGDGASD